MEDLGLTKNSITWKNILFPKMEFIANTDPSRICRILVSGASGMLGAYIGKALELTIENEPDVETHLILATNSPETAMADWQFTNASEILTYKALEGISSEMKFDYVLHFGSPSSAGNEPSSGLLREMNDDYLKMLIESTKAAGYMVYLSSSEVYGLESEHSHSASRYALAKQRGEQILASKMPRNSVSVRLFHTFGPGLRQTDRRGFARILQADYLDAEEVLTSPESRRFFLSNYDFARAINLVSKMGLTGIVDIGGGTSLSMHQFAEKIRGRDSTRTSGLDEVTTFKPNLSKLHSLGWQETLDLDTNLEQLRTWQALTWNKDD